MTQGVQYLHFDVIASLAPCHSVATEYLRTQTAKYSVIRSCKISALLPTGGGGGGKGAFWPMPSDWQPEL